MPDFFIYKTIHNMQSERNVVYKRNCFFFHKKDETTHFRLQQYVTEVLSLYYPINF